MPVMVDASSQARIVRTHSVEETLRLGASLASGLGGGAVLAINGPLGSGKTVLVRGLIRGLGGEESLVGSPTFGIAHEYPISPSLRMMHVDCYRLSGSEDLLSIGWEDFAGSPDAITVLEWADRISESLPKDCIRIDAGHVGEQSREFEIHASR